MSVLTENFDKSVNQASPVQKDFERVVQFDSDKNEVISYREVDYPSIQKRNGSVKVWSLDELLKAGINPSFAIHTSNPSRLEGIDVVNEFASKVDDVLNDNKDN